MAICAISAQQKQAEQQLIESRERLQLAADAAEFGIWEYHLEQDRLIWDERMFALFGVDPARFQGRFQDWADALHPESRQQAEAAFRALVDHDQHFDIEIRSSAKAISSRACSGASPAPSAMNRGARSASSASTRMSPTASLAAQRLAAEEAKFRGLFERSPVGIAMNDFATGEFLEFNAAVNEPAGYARTSSANSVLGADPRAVPAARTAGSGLTA